jgi:structural maintenance of chromosome 2
MRIEELILEGFKSYPVRTTINGWDSSFNVSLGEAAFLPFSRDA